jgi:molybdate transport system regulatory protein
LIADSVNTKTIIKDFTRLGADFLYGKNLQNEGAEACVLAGMKYLPAKYDRLFIAPSNFPLTDIETVKLLCNSDADITVPVYRNKQGYPVLISRNQFDQLKVCGGNLDKFLRANSRFVNRVKVNDAGATADVSGGAEVSKIAAKTTLQTKFRQDAKLRISRGAFHFGPGLHQLITLVDEQKSVQAARLIMGMASRRARDIVHEAERTLGFKLFRFEIGGRPGGYSYLTPECRDFIERYQIFSENVDRLIKEELKRNFPDER